MNSGKWHLATAASDTTRFFFKNGGSVYNGRRNG